MSQNGDRIDIEGQVIALAGTASAGRGTMLWFNEVKDLGALRTDGGVRIEVPGEAFSAGEKPSGRCAGLEIEFEVRSSQVSGIAFVPVVAPRRARKRSRR